MKNRLSICQPRAEPQTQDLMVRMKYCVKYSGADTRLGLSSFSPSVCLSAFCLTFSPTCLSALSALPVTHFVCSISSVLQGATQLQFGDRFLQKKSETERERERWGQKVGNVKVAEATSLSRDSHPVGFWRFLHNGRESKIAASELWHMVFKTRTMWNTFQTWRVVTAFKRY